MSRKAAVVLAILLVIGPSASASSRGGDYDDRGGSRFRDNRLSGRFFNYTFRDRCGDDDKGAGGSRNRFRPCGARDIWGHWGAYYGPMI
jgi:hypothetical protein